MNINTISSIDNNWGDEASLKQALLTESTNNNVQFSTQQPVQTQNPSADQNLTIENQLQAAAMNVNIMPSNSLDLNMKTESETELEARLKAEAGIVNTQEDAFAAPSTDVFKEALDLLTSLGMNYIPADLPEDEPLTEEKLLEFKALDEQRREQEAYNALFNRASDDKTRAILDAVLSGATIDDVLEIRSLSQAQEDLLQIDLTDADQQRSLIKNYLSEGLDANIPSHRYMLANLDKEVDKLFDNYENEDKAKEALDYFNGKKEEEKVLKLEQIKEEQKRQEIAEQRRIENSRKWHSDFETNVRNSQWSQAKKQAIFDEYYSTIKVEEQEVPLWYLKNDMVMKKPELFQHYLDFLNNIDEKTGTFKNAAQTVDNKQVSAAAKNQLQQLASKIAQAQKRTTSVDLSNQGKPTGKWV